MLRRELSSPILLLVSQFQMLRGFEPVLPVDGCFIHAVADWALISHLSSIVSYRSPNSPTHTVRQIILVNRTCRWLFFFWVHFWGALAFFSLSSSSTYKILM